VTARSTNKLHT